MHTPNMPIPSAPPLLPEEDVQLMERKKCNQCSYETNTDTEFNHHIESKHGAHQKDYRGIKATGYPIGHAMWATNKNMNTTEHKCNECNSVFSDESRLRAHMSKNHNSNYNHTCKNCSIVFNTNIEIIEHINKTHNNGSNIEMAVLNMSKLMETFSQRLQSIEQMSLTNFPNLGPQLKKI